MATRSTITYLNEEDGKFYGIYCHWDGYLDHHVPILRDHYNTYDKVKELVSKGDMSVLAESLDKCEFFTDRGEDLRVTEFCSLIDYKMTGRFKEEFNYLFMNGIWYVYAGNKTYQFKPKE